MTVPAKASGSIDPYLSILSYGRDMVQTWKPHAGPQSGQYKGDETVPLSSLITATTVSHGPMTWSANILVHMVGIKIYHIQPCTVHSI